MTLIIRPKLTFSGVQTLWNAVILRNGECSNNRMFVQKQYTDNAGIVDKTILRTWRRQTGLIRSPEKQSTDAKGVQAGLSPEDGPSQRRLRHRQTSQWRHLGTGHTHEDSNVNTTAYERRCSIPFADQFNWTAFYTVTACMHCTVSVVHFVAVMLWALRICDCSNIIFKRTRVFELLGIQHFSLVFELVESLR